MASQRISVRVSSGVARLLKERSRATGAQPSQVVREALEQYLSISRKEETTFELLQKTGLIGCAPGLPRDLSTNRRYFRGFGKSR